jgi:glycosyltransferase involved in cell wall biosynthesis
MTAAPRVSVITIFKDEERFLPEAVASVFAQSFGDWELLLVDDGSQDGSRAFAQEEADRWPGRVRPLTHPQGGTRGMSASRNLGIFAARGDYVAFLDADDTWLPGKLEAQLRLAHEHPQAGLICGPTQFWRSWAGGPGGEDSVRDLGIPTGTLVAPPALLPLLLRNVIDAPATCTAFLPRAVLQRLGGFEENFTGMFEDRVFFTKAYLHLAVVASPTCWDRYRQHVDSASARARRDGVYHPHRANVAHRTYLDWVEDYLLRHGVGDADVWAALRAARRRYAPVRRIPMVVLDKVGLGEAALSVYNRIPRLHGTTDGSAQG